MDNILYSRYSRKNKKTTKRQKKDKKTSFFLPNKDKIPYSCKANVVSEFSCPGCGYSYIGKTERSLEARLSEHANINSYKTSAITQHLLN